MSELFASAKALGLVMAWGSKSASIRLNSPDQAEPISIGWVFLEGDQWTWAKCVTFGVDPNTLKNHPSVGPVILDFCEKLKGVPGGQPASGKSNARIFAPPVFVAVRINSSTSSASWSHLTTPPSRTPRPHEADAPPVRRDMPRLRH